MVISDHATPQNTTNEPGTENRDEGTRHQPLTISVIGCGYLGATHAAVLAHQGHRVIGLDVDPNKIDTLRQGRAPFHEPDLDPMIETGVRTGALTFTTDYQDLRQADVHFLCVGTPQKSSDGACDTGYVHAAIEALKTIVKPGDVIVGKSTVPVGTARQCLDALTGTGATLLWNPEFLREGFAVADSLRPDRIVIGVPDGDAGTQAQRVIEHVYAPQLRAGTPLVVTDLPTSELVKTAANAFLATKISFINAVAELCERAGGDVTVLAHAIGLDDRIGPKFLRAGIGFGGGCLPKDIRALGHRASELDAPSLPAILQAVDNTNQQARRRAYELTTEHTRPGGTVTVLGAAFKPDSDDIRDSPAMWLIETLVANGYTVNVHDPSVPHHVIERTGAHPHPSAEQAAENTDVIVVATEWSDYRTLDPASVSTKVNTRHVVDLRNTLDRDRWTQAGFSYRALGRG